MPIDSHGVRTVDAGVRKDPYKRRVSVIVIRPGMLTTVQDTGRWGYQARGVPVAGPMDPVSHRIANALVGNARDAALLEITLLGPELAFEDERIAAVAGAEFELSIDGHRVSVGHTVHGAGRVAAACASASAAAVPRAYLAVVGRDRGGCPTLGSRATHLGEPRWAASTVARWSPA